MKIYRYNLDQTQARYFANLPSGERMVIVVPLKKQPPEGFGEPICGRDEILFQYIDEDCLEEDENIWIKLPYPIGARVGLQETWEWEFPHDHSVPSFLYKADFPNGDDYNWRSAQCMPTAAIRYWGIVEEARVDRLTKVTYTELMSAGCREDERTEDWFNTRYAPKWTWEMNPYVEIFKMRME